MGFFIGLLTVLMVLDCLFLVLLVLMQLPKKEAGAGLAFGSGATDALFGAGSGNFLTKATKYTAVVFFAFAIVLSFMQNIYSHRAGSEFRRQMEQQAKNPPAAATPATTPTSSQPAILPATNSNNLLLKSPAAESEATNSAPATAPK
jgi:preprotein translocase subunit SecG